MNFTIRPLSLLITLALCSFVLSAIDTAPSSAAPGALSELQSLPSSRGDASVPPASTIAFPVAEEATAPTF